MSSILSIVDAYSGCQCELEIIDTLKIRELKMSLFLNPPANFKHLNLSNPESMRFMHNYEEYYDDEINIGVIAKSYPIIFLSAPIKNSQPKCPDVHFDEISLMIARGMAESEICHPHLLPSLIGLLQFQDTKANLQILESEIQQSAPTNQSAESNINHNPNRWAGIRWLSWRALARVVTRVAVSCLLFDRGHSTTRFLVSFAVAIIGYLFEIGVLGILRHQIFGTLPAEAGLEQVENNERGGFVSSMSSTLAWIRDGMPILRREASLFAPLMDLIIVLFSLVASLFPAWHPIPYDVDPNFRLNPQPPAQERRQEE